MAQFDANINLRVQTAGAEKNIRELERRLASLQDRLISTDKRNKGPASNLNTGRQVDATRTVYTLERRRLDVLRAQTKETDARITRELRLAAAQQRQATILQALERAGGASTQAGRERIEAAVQASKVASKSLSVQNAVNVLLEKELQIRREVNRTAAGAAAGQRNVYDYSGQIRALEQLGATEGQLREATRLRDQLNQQLSRNQIDLSKATDAALRRELELLEARLQLLAATRAEQQRQTNAYAYPIGPNQRSSGRSRFGAVSNAEIDAAMVRGMQARREAFYRWEAQQARTVYSAWDRSFFGPAMAGFERIKKASASIGSGLQLGGRINSAAIGGAFPLLFGQSPQAAVGGAIGGLLGGQAGGFGGSLIGTAIGELQATKDKVKELGAELGFTSVQAGVLGTAFQQAGRDADKLEAAVLNIQGLGLSATETASALKLSSELASEYGGKVDKIAQAFADTLESGKVSISTLNRFTAQGIPIQEELARKYGVSRSAILQMAKDGKIPVQDLIDVMVKLGRAAEETANKKTNFEQFTSSVRDLATAVGEVATALITRLGPALSQIIKLATTALDKITAALQSNIGLDLAKAGTSFTFNAQAQGVDNLNSAFKQIKNTVPQTVEETDRLLGNLADISRLLQRVTPGTTEADRAVKGQRLVMEEQKRLLALREKLQKQNPAAAITPITAPAQLDPTGSGKDKEKEKAAYDYSAQNQADLAHNAIELSRQVFENDMELARQLYQQKLDYQDKLNKLNAAQLTGAGARGIFEQLAQLRKTQQDYVTQTRDLDDKIAKARKDLADARAGVALAGMDATRTKVTGGSTSGIYYQGGIGPRGANQYGPHFDIKRSDGSYFPRNSLDQYVSVNGRPLSSGTTVPGGEYGAPRSYGGHAGWDYAFSGRAGLSLQNGAKWVGSSTGSYGDATAFMTPDGKVYKILHGTFQPGAPTGGPIGNQTIAPGGQPNMGGIIGAQGEADRAQAALDGLLRQQQALNQAQAASKALDMPTAIAEATQGLRDQTLQLQNQNQALQLRTRLEIEGVKPEIIEGELAKLELSQRAIEFENGLKAAVEAKNIKQEDANRLLNAYKDAVNGAAEAVDQLTQAQLAAADPINRLISQWGKELADVRGQFAQLAGTIRSEFASAMSGAVTGAITGTQSVSQAFGQMFANIGRAFIDMATQMLAQQVVLSILQGIAGGLTGGFRGFSGAGPYQFPSMGSYSAGFTSSMSFLASGGPMAAGRPYIVGEEGPELILPSQGGYVLNADETQQALADARGAFADNRSALNSITSTSREQQTERLLTSGASSTEIKYSRVGSGDLPFVTEADMLQAARLAAQEGARMGQQRTMAALKNNPGARRTVGL